MKPFLVLPKSLIKSMKKLYGNSVKYFAQEGVPVLKASQTSKKARRTVKRMREARKRSS